MKFDWSKFTEADFNQYCDWVKNGTCSADEHIGTVHVGELAFDLVTREFATGTLTLTFDCFIGGQDTGYGYSVWPAVDSGKYTEPSLVPSEELYPYDYVGTGVFNLDDTCTSLNYIDFIEIAKLILSGYIWKHPNMGLVEKAKKPLLIF